MRFIWAITHFQFSGFWKRMYSILVLKFPLVCKWIRIYILYYFLIPSIQVIRDLVPYYQCIPSSHYQYIVLAHSLPSKGTFFFPLFGGILIRENTEFFQNRLWNTAPIPKHFQQNPFDQLFDQFLIHFTVQLLIFIFLILISYLPWSKILRSREIISVMVLFQSK